MKLIHRIAAAASLTLAMTALAVLPAQAASLASHTRSGVTTAGEITWP